jgi:hypothetical protein
MDIFWNFKRFQQHMTSYRILILSIAPCKFIKIKLIIRAILHMRLNIFWPNITKCSPASKISWISVVRTHKIHHTQFSFHQFTVFLLSNILLNSELLGFWTLSFIQYSRNYKIHLEMLHFLVCRIPDHGQSKKPSNSEYCTTLSEPFTIHIVKLSSLMNKHIDYICQTNIFNVY